MKTRKGKKGWRYLIPFNIERPGVRTNQRDNSNKIIIDGKRNDFPQYLIDLIERAPFAKAALSRRAAFVRGRGLVEDFAEIAINDEYSLNEFHARISQDFNYSKRFAFIVQFVKGGRINSVKHIPFEWVRYGDPGKDSDDIWYASVNPYTLSSDDSTNKNIYYPLYEPSKTKLAEDIQRLQAELDQEYRGHLFFFNETTPRNRIYSRPGYFSAENAIHADAAQWQFLERFLHNNMFMGGIINVHGDPDEEIQDEKGEVFTTVGAEFDKEVSALMSGASNAGSFLVHWYQEGEPADIRPWQNGNNHEVLESIREAIREMISVAFGVPQILLGVQTSGKLGDAQEVRNAIKSLNENTEGMRETLEEVYRTILDGMGISNDGLSISKLQDFTDIPNYVFAAFTSEQKQNFIAEEYGLEPGEVKEGEPITDLENV